MDRELENIASVVGTYNNLPTSMTSQALVVAMIDGLSITKSADKQSWVDGSLTYTIKIDNQATQSYENPVITDVLDNTLVDFVEDSVYIDGEKATASQYTYDAATHTLTINLSSIESNASSTVTFQVSKKS